MIIRIEESLYFANIGQVKELFQKIEKRGNSPLHAIIFDAGNVPHIDTDAIQVLLEMVTNKGCEIVKNRYKIGKKEASQFASLN